MKSRAARPYSIRVDVKPGAKPNEWNTSTVTILHGEDEIGSYERNYAPCSGTTFEPFQIGDAWFALYAPDYTGTRVLRLPECVDIGGEEPHPHGFCPVEFFVPRYRRIQFRSARRTWNTIWYEMEAEESLVSSESADIQVTRGPWLSLDIAFVAGCLWGNDSSWKLQVIDLSCAATGRIDRAERLGYLQLANMPLSQAVQLQSYLPYWEHRATIIRQELWDVRTGALIDPFE